MKQQWSPGVIVAIAIFACGLAVGAVCTAIAFSPLDAIDTVSKTQNIFAAGVAFIAAVIAYRAQTAKVTSDEGARREDQQSKIDALQDEVLARNNEFQQTANKIASSIERAGPDNLKALLAMGPYELQPMVDTAKARSPLLWEGLERTPRQLREDTLGLLLAHEELVQRCHVFAQALADSYQTKNIGRAWDVIVELAKVEVEGIEKIMERVAGLRLRRQDPTA